MKKRYNIKFYGKVVGVGFRNRLANACRELGITGWVENHPSHRWVMAEMQGKAELINQAIEEVKKGQYVSISEMVIEEIPLVEKESHFLG